MDKPEYLGVATCFIDMIVAGGVITICTFFVSVTCALPVIAL